MKSIKNLYEEYNDDLENLDDFYKRYKKRDDEFIEEPEKKNYYQVIPNKYNKNPNIKQNLNTKFDDYLEKSADMFYKEGKSVIPPIFDEKDLEKYDKDKLTKTIEIIFNDLDILNGKRGINEPHFNAIQKFINTEKIKKNVNKF